MTLGARPSLGAGEDTTPCGKGVASVYFEEGVRLVEADESRAAIAAFEAAYRCRPHYAVLFNISQAQVRLGEFDEARRSLERYLDEGGADISTTDREKTAKQLALLEGLARKEPVQPAPLASLLPRCAAPSARLEIDGESVAAPPLPRAISVASGTRHVRFLSYGFTSSEQQVTLAPRQEVEVACQLRVAAAPNTKTGSIRVRNPPPGAYVTVDGVRWSNTERVPIGSRRIAVLTHDATLYDSIAEVREGDGIDIQLQPQRTPPLASNREPLASPDSRTSEGFSWVPYTLGGVALAAGATAIGLHVWNSERHAEWKQIDEHLSLVEPVADPNEAALLNARQQENNDRLDSIQSVGAVTIGLGVGAVLAAAGTVYFAVSESSSGYVAVNGKQVLVGSRW